MEPDSTTSESNPKPPLDDINLPFTSCPTNFEFYKDILQNKSDRHFESQLVGKLQSFGLIPNYIACPEGKPECKVICRSARVIDRVQWVCEGCAKRQPIRTGSFFSKLQCTILQALQMILAWCEDADINSATQFFDVKPRTASLIYDKLDELAINELQKFKLGGENTVVLTEIYPDCLNRFSPDTTDQDHVHRILMMADTNHIPTQYQLHVMRKKTINVDYEQQCLKDEVEEVLSRAARAQSILVAGGSVPAAADTVPLQQLLQHCDADMQHFLSSRIWSQAVSLCSASRELCAGAANVACASAVQRYLDTSLYRIRYGDGFYQHILRIIADNYTLSYPVDSERENGLSENIALDAS